MFLVSIVALALIGVYFMKRKSFATTKIGGCPLKEPRYAFPLGMITRGEDQLAARSVD